MENKLKSVARRIRLLRSWKSLSIGMMVGAVLALIWVVLDYFSLVFTEIPYLIALVAGFGMIGAAIGFFRKLDPLDVARSVDSRAGLKDRLVTALQSKDQDEFQRKVCEDAEEHLQAVEPKRTYPFRFGPWPGAAFGSILLAGVVFWLGNGTAFASKNSPEAEKIKEAVAKVERVAKPLSEVNVDELGGKEEQRLANELQKLAKQLERNRLDPEEAQAKAEELGRQAQELTDKRMEQARAQMQTMQQKYAQDQLEKANITPEQLESMRLSQELQDLMQETRAGLDGEFGQGEQLDQKMLDSLNLDQATQEMLKMSEAEREAMKESLEQQIKDIEKMLDDPNLSEQARKELSAKMKELQDLLSKIQFSEEVLKALKDLQSMEEYQELSKLMQEMQQASEQMQNAQELTDEEMEQLKEKISQLEEQMEEFAKQMQDPEFREQLRKQMQEMIEAMKRGELSAEACKACLGLLPGMNPLGIPAPMPGGAYQGEGENRMNQDPQELQGKTDTKAVKGQRDPSKGTESYVEIKAPTTLGTKTSVPYDKVLPQYKDKAEKAMSNKSIPKKHEKRVKDYFNSLGGKK